MAEEVKIKVVVDATQAKQEIDEVEKEGERAATGMRFSITDKLRQGYQAAAPTISQVTQSTRSGLSDVFSGQINRFGQMVNDFVLGDIDDKARATNTAREETANMFAFTAGQRGQIPQEAKNYFAARQQFHESREVGMSMINADSAFAGESLGKIFEQIGKHLGNSLSDAINTGFNKVRAWFESWNPFG
jgi:hypothetical protein